MFAGVGERTREGNDLYKEMIESVRPCYIQCSHLQICQRGLINPGACPAALYAACSPARFVLHSRCHARLAHSIPIEHGRQHAWHSECNGAVQGVNKVGEKASESKCALVFGQMNEPPGARARVALTGLTIAEYFRDIEGQDVLFFVDNIFRFTQVSALLASALNKPLGSLSHRRFQDGDFFSDRHSVAIA